MTWHRIATLEDLPPGSRKFADVGGKSLAIIHHDTGIWCIDFRCPHTGGPLGDGELVGDEIICPLHKWRFHLEDGSCGRRGACEPAGVYQLKLEGSDLLVELP